MTPAGRGRVVVISGPSGVGKTTIVRRLLEQAPVPLVRSVSATTRPPRPDETDGVDYHFLTDEEFAARRRRGEFLECFEVFGRGYWYGTMAGTVSAALEAGKWVVLAIDVNGAMAVARQSPDAITIFVRPSSLEQLETQLRGRRTESEEAVRRRLREAEHELAWADRYRYQVVNDDVEQAVEEICQILTHSKE